MQTIKLTEFLKKYQNEIAASIIRDYPPLYQFSARDKYVSDIKKLQRKPYLAQFDSISALAELYSNENGNSAILVGEMGVGKTIIAIGLIYVAKFKKILIMCPPHLVKKWEREIRLTIPTGCVECHHLKKFTDVDLTVPLANDDKFHFFIVGRERAKLSYQWRPAYNIKQYIETENKENGDSSSRVKVKYITCPKCGGLVLDAEGIPLSPDEMKKKKMICARCGEFLWQAKETGPRRFAIAEYIKRKYKGFFDLLVVDECFPAGTKVKTIDGERNIEQILPGQHVLSYGKNGFVYKQVTRVFKRLSQEDFTKVEHEEGMLFSTLNHEIYTSKGKIAAGLLRKSDIIQVLSEEGSYEKKKKTVGGTQAKDRKSARASSNQKSGIKICHFSENEEKQSNKECGCSTKNIGFFKRKGLSSQKRWPWNWINRTAKIIVSIVGCSMGNRDNSKYAKRPSSLSLFYRYCKRIIKNSCRMRWIFALPNICSGKGQEKRFNAAKTRMDCSTIQQQGNYGEYRRCGSKNYKLRGKKIVRTKNVNIRPIIVYNLEVQDTHRYFANNVLVANCHEYKGRGSAQGYAAGILASACKRSLAMTGTLFGGYSSTLFHLLYRLSSTFKKDYEYSQVSKWIDHYGIWERVTKFNDDAYGDNIQSRGRKYRYAPREKPGISPVILPKYLLDKTVFVRLSDIAIDLPSLSEEIIDVQMSEEQTEAYDELYGQLRGALLAELQRGNKSLLAVYLQTLLTYPDRCTVGEQVYNKDEQLIATAPALNSDVLYPKEQAIVDLIKKEKANGRRVLVYCTHTNRRDVTARLQEKIQSDGNDIKSEILKASVPAEKREAWIQEHAEDLDCLITNSALVQTGLDLIEFPTVAYCQAGYSVYTLRQSSRRSWRIGQDKPVKIYYFVYAATMQEQALKLLALKMKASLIIEGELGEDGLATYNVGDDNLFYELARNIANNVSIDESLDVLWGNVQEKEKKSAADDLLIESLDDYEDKPDLNGALKRPVIEIKQKYNPEIWDKLYNMMLQDRGRKQDLKRKRREKREKILPSDRHQQMGLF